MKVNKTFCLDVEIIRLLQEEKNASLLVNGYLRSYYGLDRRFIEPIKEKVIEEELKEDDLDKVFNQEII